MYKFRATKIHLYYYITKFFAFFIFIKCKFSQILLIFAQMLLFNFSSDVLEDEIYDFVLRMFVSIQHKVVITGIVT